MCKMKKGCPCSCGCNYDCINIHGYGKGDGIWIECSDIMPDKDQKVLIGGDEHIGIGHLYKMSKEVTIWIDLCHGGQSLEIEDVTHWMSLPEFPENK